MDAAAPRAGRSTGASRASSWWARRSLRARLTSAAGLIIAAGMLAAGALLVWRVHTSLVSALDADLTQQALTVADQAEHGQLPAELPDPDDGAPSIQVVTAGGRVVSASADLHGRPRGFTFAGHATPRVVTVDSSPLTDRDDTGTDYRVAAVRTGTPHGPVTVYTALSLTGVEDSIGDLVRALAVGLPILAAVLILVGWLLVGRALRPVEQLRRQAADIPGTDLTRRLRTPEGNDELSRLATTFNQLLGRIQASSARQHQFVADAAHELRSPIATLRAQLEVTGRSPAPGAAREAIPGLIGDTDRLSGLVDDLLALARLDAHPTMHRQVVDLDDIVLAQARRLRARGPVIDTTGVSAGRVAGDPAALARVVRNLLDNATRHATGTVRVRLTSRDSQVVLTVADDGPGIPQEDRDRVFERFTRLDDARSRDQGGAGLGLAIVRDVVLAHHGTVAITDNGPGAVFTVTLPAGE